MPSLSLDIGSTGLMAQQMNVDVISNNIANMTTTGYKKQRAQFNDLIYNNITRPGSQSSSVGTLVPAGIQIGLGVNVGAVTRVFEQGPMQTTNNSLDVAITGEGFFQIQLPNGETAYTRDGAFQVNENGELVTQQGYLVDPGITIPEDAVGIEINQNGEVFVELPEQVDLSNVGQLQLAIFQNNAGLEAIGDDLFLETEASAAPTVGNPGEDAFGEVRQGLLEGSNVNAVDEITSLITAQRAYEMNSRVIQVSDEMLSTISNLR